MNFWNMNKKRRPNTFLLRGKISSNTTLLLATISKTSTYHAARKKDCEKWNIGVAIMAVLAGWGGGGERVQFHEFKNSVGITYSSSITEYECWYSNL